MGKKGRSHNEASMSSYSGLSGGGNAHQKISLHHLLKNNSADYLRYAKSSLYTPPARETNREQHKKYNFIYLERLIQDRLHYDRKEEESPEAYRNNIFRQQIFQSLSNKQKDVFKLPKHCCNYNLSEKCVQYNELYAEKIVEAIDTLIHNLLATQTTCSEEFPEQRSSSHSNYDIIKPLSVLTLENILHNLPVQPTPLVSLPTPFHHLLHLLHILPSQHLAYLFFFLVKHHKLHIDLYSALIECISHTDLNLLSSLYLPSYFTTYHLLDLLLAMQTCLKSHYKDSLSWEELAEQEVVNLNVLAYLRRFTYYETVLYINEFNYLARHRIFACAKCIEFINIEILRHNKEFDSEYIEQYYSSLLPYHDLIPSTNILPDTSLEIKALSDEERAALEMLVLLSHSQCFPCLEEIMCCFCYGVTGRVLWLWYADMERMTIHNSTLQSNNENKLLLLEKSQSSNKNRSETLSARMHCLSTVKIFGLEESIAYHYQDNSSTGNRQRGGRTAIEKNVVEEMERVQQLVMMMREYLNIDLIIL